MAASAALPDAPTLEDAAKLKGFEASSWFGLLAPAGTPPEILNRIQQEVAKSLNTPAIKEKMLAQGAIPSGHTPQEFAKLIDSEIAKWAKVVKALKFSLFNDFGIMLSFSPAIKSNG